MHTDRKFKICFKKFKREKERKRERNLGGFRNEKGKIIDFNSTHAVSNRLV
jgi:hypothetical protein